MKVLYFFPHPIYPSKTGAQFRAVQTLSSLSRLGIEVHLATFSHPHYHWSTSDRNAISRFLCRSVTHLNQYHPGPERTRQGAPMKSLFFPENNRFLPDFFDQSSAAAREWIEETLQRWRIDCTWRATP